MTATDMMKLAFQDELKKIAFTRSGRKPIGIERLMERETDPDNTPSNAFADVKVPPEVFQADVEKLSSIKLAVRKGLVAGAVIGGGATLALQRMNKDRQMGRAMRLQSGG
jgi:hypothetical protein